MATIAILRLSSHKSSSLKCSSVLFALLFLLRISHCERRQFELSPELPSHLPSPPKAEAPAAAVGGVGAGGARPGVTGDPNSINNFGGSGPFGFFAGVPPVPPPQNVPGRPFPGGLPQEQFVPFGLNHIILIIVPQFKTKFRKLPGWLSSSVKISMPITVFFDKLELGPGFPPALLPPGAIGAGAGISAGASVNGPVPPPGTAGTLDESGLGQYAYSGIYPNLFTQEEEDDEDEAEDSDEDIIDDDDPYDGYYAEDRKNTGRLRVKRSSSIVPPPEVDRRRSQHLLNEMDNTLRKNRMKRSIPYNKTIHSAERATLLPRLENMLDSAGLGGKSCLLRAVCEVHEAPLHHYGLLGEMFTMFFSVSRSVFAESHLPEYLQAERQGKTGDCSEFYRDCDKTLFSWEETVIETKDNNDIFGRF